MSLRSGNRIGDREIRELIASRRMGAVYRALREDADEVVRIVAPDLAPQALTLLDPIRQELTGGAHIVQMKQIARARNDTLTYVAMEAMDRSLRDRIGAAPRGLTFEACITFMRQATDGVAYAHERGYRHGRLKPENLLLREIGAYDDQILLKIGDFGMAELAGEYTLTAEIAARYRDLAERRRLLAYAAPEQLLGGGVAEPADIYALGVILYELVTGTLPFEPAEYADALYQHTLMAPRPPRELRVGLPPELELIILKCLAKDPQARYATARELADRLGAFRLPRTYQLTPLGGGDPLPLPPGRYLLTELQDGRLDLAEESPGRPYATITAIREAVTVEVNAGNAGAASLDAVVLRPGQPERWQPGQQLRVERHTLALEEQRVDPRTRALQVLAAPDHMSRYQYQESDTLIQLTIANPLARRAGYRISFTDTIGAWVQADAIRAEGAALGLPNLVNTPGQPFELSLPITIQGPSAMLEVPLNPRYAAGQELEVGDHYRLRVRAEDLNGQFVPGNCTLSCSILPRAPLRIKQIDLDDAPIWANATGAGDSRRAWDAAGPDADPLAGVIVPRLTLESGSLHACTIQVRVMNADVGDDFQIEIEGVPLAWCRPAVRRFRYTPRADTARQEENNPDAALDRAFAFTFAVPGGSEGLAGEYPVTVKFIAASAPATMTKVFMIWHVPPVYEKIATLGVELLRASNNRATYVVTLANRGNAVCWYLLRCSDALDLHKPRPWLKFEQPLLAVQPGETAETRLMLEALARPLGKTQEYEFTIQANLANVDAPKLPALVTICKFEDHPTLQIDTIQRTILAVVMIAGFVALGLYIFERVMTFNGG
jgi:serine/threonine protein kinase